MNKKILIMIPAILLFAAHSLYAADKSYWGKPKHKCDDSKGIVKAKLHKVKGNKEEKLEFCKDKSANFSGYGATGTPDRCKKWPLGIYGYWDISNDSRCDKGSKDKDEETGAYWDKAKHKCLSGSKGRVRAKLKGVKNKEKLAICQGNNPPEMNAFGYSGNPASCDKKLTGGVTGEWLLNDDPLCDNLAYWGKPKHSCNRYGSGKVRSRILGIKSDDKLSTCQNNPPDMNAFGIEDGTAPDLCEKKLTGTWAQWNISDDPMCLPEWKTVKKKGCVAPNTQVFRARLKQIKKDADDVDGARWSKKYRHEICMNTDGPHSDSDKGAYGKPSFCKANIWGTWGYWYENTEIACETPLDWGNIKDNGCVKDMDHKDNKRGDAGGIAFESKRAYSAKLKHVGGNWYDACAQASIDEDGLKFQHPTACVITNFDKPVSYAIGAIAGGATTVMSGGTGVLAGAAVAIGTQAATELALSKTPNKFAVHGIFWKDDENCGTVPQYISADGSDEVVLQTGEISTNIGSVDEGAIPPRLPETDTGSDSEQSYPVKIDSTTSLSWGRWQALSCKSGKRVWESQIRNKPNAMNWRDACRSTVQLPYIMGNYPKALSNRLNSANPDIAYPDSCVLNRSSGAVVGRYNVADASCR